MSAIKKHRADDIPDHDVACDGSALLCDHLFDRLNVELPKLRRKKVQRWCCFYHEGQNRFAYVTHRKRSVRLEVWFTNSQNLKGEFPELEIRPRSDTIGGWKGFDSRFYVDTEHQAEQAAKLLVLSSKTTLGESQQGLQFSTFPDEVTTEKKYWEGALRKVFVNAVERNPEARRRCISHYGAMCAICGFSFADRFGPILEGFIHVHHLQPLSQVNEQYIIDPIADGSVSRS